MSFNYCSIRKILRISLLQSAEGRNSQLTNIVIKKRNSMTIPAFGLGTFRLKDDVVIASVKTALELGYRAVDTAQIYEQ